MARFSALLSCFLVSFCATLQAAATNFYDASLGTLPSAQGFSFLEGSAANPAPYATGGVLYEGNYIVD